MMIKKGGKEKRKRIKVRKTKRANEERWRKQLQMREIDEETK